MRGFGALALLLWSFPGVAQAAEPSFGGYLSRMALALLLLAAAGWAAVRYLPGRMGALRSRSGGVRVLSFQALGRDALYVLRLGPEVVVVLAGRNGSTVLGRWTWEDWLRGREGEEDETGR